MEAFEKSLGTVMKEVLARPDKFKLERNFYNQNTITVISYRENVSIELTVRENGLIVMVFDETLSKGKDFVKPVSEYSENNPHRKGFSYIQYGYTELDKFVHDYNII